MKIFITGNSGCGKTTAAKKVAKKLGIACCHFDDIVWVGNTKRPYDERQKLLDEFLQNNSDWVAEGMFHTEWMHEIYKLADYIFVLHVSKFKVKARITRRYLRKKIHLEEGNKESWKQVKQLFTLVDSYQNKIVPEILETCKTFDKPVYFVKSTKELLSKIKK